ncbi:alpha-1,6-mannosyltransferase [Noviherbaspirillum humi]|uniref:Alpha-1,6-mannosyltransferase n=1 Tax=Noviherbaspirillum humi TaxID=1688639 RepID=A0A239JLP5_9BURK|nr:glycosyltransferase [Noviherbaspirillum humi]SNT06946.1 alpha-1,6-mannosyltransferase [Noviherbaspirillum humi]
MHFVDITLFYAAEGGGVSTYLNAKARWLARHGNFRHTIVSSSVPLRSRQPDLIRIPGVAVPGVDTFRLPTSVGYPARVLRQLQPDLIEAGDAFHCAWAALRAGRRLKVPVVAFYHSDMPQLIGRRCGHAVETLARRYLAQVYRRFDMVLAPSEMMVRQLHDMGVRDAILQPLGVDTWTFCPQRRDPSLREQLRLKPDVRLLVYAGRFTPEKKLGLLIEAVRRLGKNYHLVLIGSGDELPRSRQVTLIPFQREPRLLAQLMASCDALVHPGDCETFGLVVLEAMACGLPVIGTSAGGVAELVNDDTGIRVAPNSVDALCEGITGLFSRDLSLLGQQARQRAVDQFDWNRIVPQLLNRYAGLLASQQRAELEARLSYVAD